MIFFANLVVLTLRRPMNSGKKFAKRKKDNIDEKSKKKAKFVKLCPLRS